MLYKSLRGKAYWFIDDGGKLYYNKDYARKGFIFNIMTKIRLNKNFALIVIPSVHHYKFVNYIKPYIVPSMIYKITF